MYSIIGKFTLDELAVIRHKNSTKPIISTLHEEVEKIDDDALKNKIKVFLEILKRFKSYLKTYNISQLLLKLYNA